MIFLVSGHLHRQLVQLVFFILAILIGVGGISPWFEFAFPLMASDVEHLFICLFSLLGSFLEKCPKFSLIFLWIVRFLTVGF